jgi:hypothetical protein
MQQRSSPITEAQKVCALSFDTSEIAKQLNELAELLVSRFPDGIPNEILSNFASLSFDVVFADNRSTLNANGTIKISNRLRLGSGFEHLRATVLAGEWNAHEEATFS